MDDPGWEATRSKGFLFLAKEMRPNDRPAPYKVVF